MKFGFYTPNSGSTGDPALVLELATWWMVECLLLSPDELRGIADAGPHRFIRAETM